jgi:putative FmdB family regulatory protein
MPLYEYQCESCSHRFERIQKFSDPPADTCPKCGGAVRKLISSPAIQFKGSGFYITDYGKQGSSVESKSQKADKAGAAAESKSDSGGGEGKSESKAEGKSEAKAEPKAEKKESSAKAE